MKRADQRGMASIVITMVTMVVISLIVIGFATVSRREQRQSLDQLLSSQAFYAAESGVEDAKSIIKQSVQSGQPVVGKTDCTTNDTGGNYPTGNQMIVDATSDVRYTCLKIDPAPDQLQYDGVSGSSIVVPITTDLPITSLRVTWRPSSSSGSPMTGCPNAAVNSFTPQTNWTCGHGVLRADLVPTGNGLTSAALANGQLSGYFVPVTVGSTGRLGYVGNTGRANVTAADCSANTSCSATLDTLASPTQLSLRLSSMYQASDITIQAFTGSNPQDIKGVQAIVDATGRATDVLRRIQVRLPIVQTGTLFPSSAITSNGAVCKRFTVAADYFNIPGDIIDPDTTNEMCSAKTISSPSGGGGNATIDPACGAFGCTPTPPGGVYHYDRTLRNLSNNSAADITGCRWDFGDGTIVNNQSCQYNQTIQHTYAPLNPEPPYPNGCYSRWTRATLTIYLRNGTTASDTMDFDMPVCY